MFFQETQNAKRAAKPRSGFWGGRTLGLRLGLAWLWS